jgi:protein-S-isoprenylcysteine O-methyltransferase Ste14
MAILLWVLVDRKAAVEEAWLGQRYGGEYAAYRERVTKKFIPCLY